MEHEILRGELERLFELDDLINLSRDILGVSPDDVGGMTSEASYARALVGYCTERGMVDALMDAAEVLKKDFDPKARAVLQGPQHDELHNGAQLGPYTIQRTIGQGPSATVYLATDEGRQVVLKVLWPSAIRSDGAFARFAAVCRLVARVQHDSIPKGLVVGEAQALKFVAYDHVEAQTLSARTARSGPMHINEARAILKGVLEALAELHKQRIVHGNIKLDNVLIERAKNHVLLIDAGCDRLRMPTPSTEPRRDILVVVADSKTMAPEQVRGARASARSDVYAFGVMMYELLTGKPLFPVKPGIDFAIAQLSTDPDLPQTAAPRGWVSKDVSDFVMALLAREPESRPKDAKAVLEAFERLGRTAQERAAAARLSDEQLAERIDALIISPSDEAAAAALDEAVEAGVDAEKVAQAFLMAGDQLEGEPRKSLLFRAARLYESNLSNLEEAEKVYGWIVELDATDELASTALQTVRKQLGKYEEVIEMLLARIELSSEAEDRAEAMAEIGRIYAEDIEDAPQAVVAYAQAFAEAPWHAPYADAIEQHAGADVTALGEAIGILANATQGELQTEHKNKLFQRLGYWYAKKLGRSDAALSCYQAIIATDPVNDAALDGMAGVFRVSQQYGELGQVLLRRAESTSNAARAREFKAEAAELLEARLEQPAKAKELYEQILEADPAHVKAGDALLRIYEKEGNAQGLVKLLERRALALRGAERAPIYVRMGRLLEEKIKDYSGAVKSFESAIEADPKNNEALDALDVIYTRSGHCKELIANIERQLEIASTPRQKIGHLERIAKIWEEEFLDHQQAVAALERVLEVDPANIGALGSLGRHLRALDRWEDVAQVCERELKVTTEVSRRVELLLTMARVLTDKVGSPERAMKAYEEALEIEPHHAGALEALAHLREQAGDAQAALTAIDTLAQKATNPKERAEHLIRAAKLLGGRGDSDGAIEKYKQALDANPRDASASGALRKLLIERGDTTAALELISRDIEYCEVPSQKAKLCAEAAKLAREKLKDPTRAEISAKEALEYEPTQIEALTILGDIAFESSRMIESLHHFEQVVSRLEMLPREWAVRVMRRYIEGLVHTDGHEKALALSNELLELAPDDAEAMMLAGRVFFDKGDAKRSLEVHQQMLDRIGAKLMGSDKAAVLYRHGESARRAGDAVLAIKSLSEAADMDPAVREPLAALAKVYESKGDWEEVIRVKSRRLDVAAGDERVELLVEIGEICAGKLNDRTRAAKSFVAALDDRPDDRKLLTRLMQLYSEAKEWAKLVDVVLKLADFVDERKQKAKYIHTAAVVTGRELHDFDKAIEFFDKVLDLDPTLDRAIDESIEMRDSKQDYEGVEKMLKMRLERATEDDKRELILKTFDALAELYNKKLGLVSEAIDAYEAAQMLDPDNATRNGVLAEMYASDPAQYLDKAVASQRALLVENPNRAESYKLLRRLYTEAKRADSAWCLCQALGVLGLADGDEDRFYRRMRSETAAPAQDRLTEELWVKNLIHEDADPILTGLIALIEPAVLATRADTLENLGYDARYAIDLAMHPYPMSQTIYYAAGVLGMQSPPTFQNINDEGGISFLHAQVPSVVLGRAAFEVEVPQQAAAFIVARHLSYYRPGMYVRHLVPTGTGLKAWVFAAIKMNAPQFPISADLEGPVAENLGALATHLGGPTKERLASLVSKLLQQSIALDLKKWVAAVDLTADRAGLLVAHDLETAAEMVKASDESVSPVSHQERLKQLVLYSVSERYFALRRHLGVAIDS